MEILLVIHVIITVFLIILILMQRSSSDGFVSSGGGGGNSLMTGRSSANLMTRSTAILAALFMANSLLLAYLSSKNGDSTSLFDQVEIEETAKEIEKETTTEKESLSVPIAE